MLEVLHSAIERSTLQNFSILLVLPQTVCVWLHVCLPPCSGLQMQRLAARENCLILVTSTLSPSPRFAIALDLNDTPIDQLAGFHLPRPSILTQTFSPGITNTLL